MSLLVCMALLSADPVVAPWDTEARIASLEKKVSALEAKTSACYCTPKVGAAAPLLPGQTHPYLYNVGDNINKPTGPAAAQFYAAGGANMGLLVGEPLSAVPTTVEVKQKRNKTVIKTRTSSAFECVNNQRARKGLRPFAWNESLARAAEKCAAFKAAHCLSGHTQNDFSFIDDGAQCVATGADGSKISAGDPNWWTCCMDENYPYAGAGMAVGADGNKYYSLFVSYSPAPASASETAPAISTATEPSANPPAPTNPDGKLCWRHADGRSEYMGPNGEHTGRFYESQQPQFQFMLGSGCPGGNCSSRGR